MTTDPELDSETSYWVGGPRVAWRETTDEVVVLDLRQSVYFGLNSAAARLWKRLTEGARQADLVEVVLSCGADPARAAADVSAFLASLREHGLLSESQPEPSDRFEDSN